MRILFDVDFDGGVWPGPRGDAPAVAGATWVGEDGLLLRLETSLGLGGRHASAAERAAALVPRLFREDPFFGASARTDPWATAQRLLELRDHLWEHGWRGESAGERRLGELADVTLDLPAGRAERIETVAGWLETRAVDVEEVGLLAPRADLSPAWRRVLSALERGGTRILERRSPENGGAHDPIRRIGTAVRAVTTSSARHPRTNLDAVRAPDAAISSPDTTLQLVRPHGPREAARTLAAALAADPGFGETLFIGPDGVLDEALDELGLPTLGAPSAHDAGALAELLPMTLQLAWAPVDPQLALDWLTLPDLPLPRGLAARLATTLDRWPAVGNPDWMAVMETALAARTEANEEARATLETVFLPIASRGDGMRVRELVPRLDLLERWSARRAPTSPAHERVLKQTRTLRRRFERAELTRLTPPRLDAVLASAAQEPEIARRPSLAGYASVALPGGVAGPARRVIWWGFHGAGSATRGAIALRTSERRALASIDVHLPPPGAAVRSAAARARRPLALTSETLILVAPRHDETGEATHPHPLWDEIVSHLADPASARHLVREAASLSIPSARLTVPIEARARPERVIHTSLPLAPRPVESPTSLEKLLGCSFAYALEYNAHLRRRSPSVLTVGSRLLGSLAHEILAETARAGALSEGDPKGAALALLDRVLRTHAALLLMPGHPQDRLLLRDAVAKSVTLLAGVVQAEGLRVHSVETRLGADLGGRTLQGTPDLVLADPAGKLILLDLKWSGEVYRREQLRSGAALQLAAYAALLARGGASVRAVGFLILTNARLLVRGEPLALAQHLGPGLLDETWAAAERSWDERAAELARGDLFAEGVATEDHTPPGEALLVGGRLVVPPPCGFCALDLLCGRGIVA